VTAPRLLVLVLVLVLRVLVRVGAASCPAQPDDAPLVHGGDLADAARGGDVRAAVGPFFPSSRRSTSALTGRRLRPLGGHLGWRFYPPIIFSVLLRSWS
jgi:hypothetical protein